jgi:hypothetical protein
MSAGIALQICTTMLPAYPLFKKLFVSFLGVGGKHMRPWLCKDRPADCSLALNLSPLAWRAWQPSPALNSRHGGGAWIEGLPKVATYSPGPQLLGACLEIDCPFPCDLGVERDRA